MTGQATAWTPRSIAELLKSPVAKSPLAEALVGPSASLSYQELDRAVDQTASALSNLGIVRGATVAVSLPNDVDIVILFHAVMRIGALWVGINQNLAPPEQAFILHDGDVRLFICDPQARERIQIVEASLGKVQILEVEPGDVLGDADPWSGGERFRSDSANLLDAAPIDPLAPAALAYTSGTTGRPKAVMLSQHNLVVPGEVLVATRAYDASLRKGDCLPLTILNLIVLSTLLTAQAHGTCVLMSRRDPEGIADEIERGHVTTWNGVPAMLSSMADDPRITTQRLRTLNEVWSGGDAISPEIADRFRSKFGISPISTYGLTEAPTVVTIDDRIGRSRVGASGRALPHIELTIRDHDGNRVPSGVVGDMHLAATTTGPWAGLYRPMLGYRDNQAATAEVLHDGRLQTGDVGRLDTDGYLTVVSRRSSVIIRGGANVYPAEVERVLGEIAGIRAAAVFGIDDERLGQRVAAAIETDGSSPVETNKVRERCRRQLAGYKVPDLVIEVPRLPRNAMGKIVRTDLVALAVNSDDTART